jgi:cell division septal protein FtsQ
MWFKGKPGNKKFARQHVLHVRMRSQHIRARRWRIIRSFLTVAAGIAAILFIVWRGGEWMVDELVFNNPAFGIEEIAVQTGGVLPSAQIRQWAGVKEGDNLFAVDLARIRRDLELVSLIERASVHRVFPHKLVIRVVEREPLVRIPVVQPQHPAGLKQASFYLDASGYVIVPPRTGPRTLLQIASFESLPLLTGLAQSQLRPGRTLDSPQVLSALQLLIEFGRSPMATLEEVRLIHLASPHAIQVVTANGAEITFRAGSFDRQLRRWQLIHQYGLNTGRSLATLDLSVSNNVPARWKNAAAVPPAAPHRQTQYRPGRPNV